MSRNRSTIRFAFLGIIAATITAAIAFSLSVQPPPANAQRGGPFGDGNSLNVATATNGKIFFSSNRTGGIQKVYTMNPDGSDVTCLMCGSGDTRVGRLPAVSPDGTTVAYVDGSSPTNIRLMNIDGTNDRALTAGSSPAWSPQSDRILFTRNIATPTPHNELFIISTNGSGEAPLNDSPTHNNVLPTWSIVSPSFPEGRIAFRSSRDGNSEIYVIAPTAGQNFQDAPQVNVTNNPANDSDPAWSPDGTKLAFQSDRFQPGALGEIYTMELNPNPGTVTRLTSDGPSPGGFNDSSPVWAPDGTKIAIVSFRGSFEIVVINSTTGAPIEPPVGGNITNNSAVDFDADWAAGPTNPRTIRAVDVTASAGQQVVVSFELASLGDEAGVSFTVNFDQTKLSNPFVTLGSGAPAGANIGTNLSQALSGRVGVLLDSTTPFAAGNRQMFTVRFNVAANAAAGPTAITFGGSPTVQSVTNSLGAPLTTTYQPGNVNITAAPAATNGKIVYQQGANAGEIYTILPGSGVSTGIRPLGIQPSYSPDGTRIAYVDITPGGTFGFIKIMNADGSSPRELSPPRRGFTPVWSPDGTRLAYVRGQTGSLGGASGIGELYVADGTPGNEGANEVLVPMTQHFSKPAWSSTNRIAAACATPRPAPINYDPLGICVTSAIPASSQLPTNPPTVTPVSGPEWNDRDVAWSPNGGKIAFISTRDYPMFNASEIYTMNPDGTSPTRLTNTVDFKSYTTWSPDGTRIAYSRGGNQGSQNASLRSVNADGSNGANPSIITLFGSGDVFPNWGAAPPAQADVRITNIGDTPDPTVINQRVFYQVGLFNAGPSPATGVKLTTDPLPAGVDFSNQSPSYCVFGTDRVVTCTLPNGLGTTGLDNSLRVDIAVIPRQLGTINFKAVVTATQQDPVLANNEATATTTVLPSADLALDVTGPSQATVDSNVTYQMVVTSNGPDSAFGVRTEFNMPTGVDFISAEPGIFNCTPGPISGGTRVSCDLGTMAGGTLTPRITVKPRNPGPILVGGQVFVSGSSDTVPGNDADSMTTTVADIPRADLGITVSYSPNVLNNSVRVGDQYTQYFTVRNLGPAAATNVTIIFTTAAGVSPVPTLSDPRCASTGNDQGQTLYVCSIGNLANGASSDFVGITVTALTAGTRSDSASVTANEPEPTGGSGNNSVTANVSVLSGIVDLEMINSSPSEIFLGDIATLTIRVKNNGPSAASNVRARVQRFSGTQLVAINSLNCTDDAGIITCPLGNLAPGEQSSIVSLDVRPSSTGATPFVFSTISDTNEISPDPHPNTRNINVNVKPRVEFLGMEVTQGVQDLNNSIPVIRGRPTYVRAYLRSQGTATVTPELTGRRSGSSGTTLLGTIPLSNAGRSTIGTDANPDRDSFENNPYFLIPESWLDGVVVFELTLRGNPGPLVCNDADGVADCKSTVTFRNSVDLPVEFIRMTYTNGTTNVSTTLAQRNLAIDQINSIFPVRAINWNETFMTIDPSVSGFPCTANTDLTRILNLVAAKQALDCPAGNCSKRYLGLVAPSTAPAGATNCNGGLAFRPGFAGMSFVYALGSGAELNPAHEMGHSLNLRHTAYTLGPGGAAGNPGPHDPADGTISVVTADFDKDTVYGFDAQNLNRYDTSATPGTQRVFGPTTPNFMSYASARKWISEIDYKRALFYLEGNGVIATTRPDLIEVDDIVLVSGLIALQPGGTTELSPIYSLTSSRTIALPTGTTHELRFEGAQGQTLASYNFDPVTHSDADFSLTGTFSYVLPRIAGTSRVSVWRNGQMLVARQASATAPQVSVVSPNGGETLTGAIANLSWTATDADAGSSLEYLVQFSPDGGTTWQTQVSGWRSTTYALNLRNLRATTQGLIRVLASDGFNTSQDLSNSTFTVSGHAPEASIRSPRASATVVGDQRLVLEGEAYDVEEGLLGDAGLTWTSSLNGPLGTGRSLTVDASSLQEGTHTITLTGRDSNGQIGTATTSVSVFRIDPVLPPTLSLNISQAIFNAFGGVMPTQPQTLTISNTGGGTLAWNAAANQSWIRLSSVTGTAPSNISIVVDPTGLALGTYSGTITLTANGSAANPQIVNVYLSVVEAPLVSVTGRVVTPSGIGLRNARVTLVNPQGVVRSATTSSFGTFSFNDVPGGATYTISTTSKRYRFPPRIITVNGNLNVGDIVGLE